MFAAAAAVTVRALSASDAELVELIGLPIEVDSVVMTIVVTLSSRRSSLRAATILSSESLKTTSPE